MTNKFSSFVKLLEKFNKAPISDYGNSPIKFSKAEFLKHIYVPNPVLEEKIMSEIDLATSNPICIVGPRGSGKSTVGLKIKHDLTATDPDIFIAEIDIKIELGKSAFDHGEYQRGHFRKFLREKITRIYVDRLYKTKGDNNHKYKLFEFILKNDIEDANRPADLFSIFTVPQNRFEEYLKEDDLADLPLDKWIQRRVSHDDEVIRFLIDYIEREIDIEHLAFALHYIEKTSKQIIWIDNIDSLSELDQIEMIAAINEIIPILNDMLTFVVAVREENIIQSEHPRNSVTDPFNSIIYWNYDDGTLRDSSEAWLLPVASKNRIIDIMDKRIHYINERILEIPNARINYLDGTECKIFCILVQNVIHAFDNERGIYIANNSIRDILMTLTGFLAYLLDNGSNLKEEPRALKYQPWRLQTEFLFWLSRSAEPSISFNFYDILKHSISYLQNGNDVNLGCFQPYLILTTIWNLCLEKEHMNNDCFSLPSIAAVIDRLSNLGYTESEVVDSLFQLCRHNHGKGKNNFIAIQMHGELKEIEDIKPYYTVRLTYRGQVTINSVCNSYGYLSGLLIGNLLNDQPERGSNAEIKAMTECLKIIAKAHLLSLQYIRDHNTWAKSNQEHWIRKYYQYYSTPLIPEFCRVKNLKAVGFKQIHRSCVSALFFELLVHSIVNYRVLATPRAKATIGKVRKEYETYIKSIYSGESISADEVNATFARIIY